MTDAERALADRELTVAARESVVTDRERSIESAIGSALKTIQQIKALLKLIDRPGVVKSLRHAIDDVNAIPTLEHDLAIAEGRLTGLLSSPPDLTPRLGVSSATLKAALRADDEDTLRKKS